MKDNTICCLDGCKNICYVTPYKKHQYCRKHYYEILKENKKGQNNVILDNTKCKRCQKREKQVINGVLQTYCGTCKSILYRESRDTRIDDDDYISEQWGIQDTKERQETLTKYTQFLKKIGWYGKDGTKKMNQWKKENGEL